MFRTNCVFILVTVLSTISFAIKTCCPPSQYEANIVVSLGLLNTDGRISYVEGTIILSWDGVNKVSAMNQTLMASGTPLLQTIISDYRTGVSHIVRGENCEEESLLFFVPGCIPENATEKGYSYGLGGESMDVTGYHVDYGDFQFYTTVTMDTCVPVSQVIVGKNGSLTEFLRFRNVTAGLKSRSVFDIPTQCKEATAQVPPVGRRSLFALV